MWYINLLKQFLGSKVEPKDQQNIATTIDSIFDKLSDLEAPPRLESVLHMLSYMKQRYFDIAAEAVPLTQISDDLKSAIIIAEKVSDEQAVWVDDFAPQFGSVNTLKQNERIFWGETLKHNAAIDKDNILILFAQSEDPSVISGFIEDALKLKRDNPSEDSSLLDELLSEPLVAKYNTEALVTPIIPEDEVLTSDSNESELISSQERSDSLVAKDNTEALVTPIVQEDEILTSDSNEHELISSQERSDSLVAKDNTEALVTPIVQEDEVLTSDSNEHELISSQELLELTKKTINHYISSRQNIFFNLFRNTRLTSEKVKLAQQLVDQLETAKKDSIGLSNLSAIFESFSEENANLETRENNNYKAGFSSGFERALKKCVIAVENERDLQNDQQSRPH